jgi:hypothetical protein
LSARHSSRKSNPKIRKSPRLLRTNRNGKSRSIRRPVMRNEIFDEQHCFRA